LRLWCGYFCRQAGDNEECSIADIISEHRSNSLHFQSLDNSHCIRIRRNHLWEDACVKFNQEFDCTKPLQIQFVNEDGVDGGGIRREFFARAVKSAGELLEGPSDSNRHNLAALNSKKVQSIWYNSCILYHLCGTSTVISVNTDCLTSALWRR